MSDLEPPGQETADPGESADTNHAAERAESEETFAPPSAVEAEIAPPPPVESVSWSRLLRRVSGTACAFAVIGLLLGLRAVAVATLPHILQLGDYVAYQELTDGLPVPRLLDWNLTFVHLLLTLGEMNVVLQALLGILLFLLLWLTAVAAINPTFRLFEVVRRAPTDDSKTPARLGLVAPLPLEELPAPLATTFSLETPRLLKAFSLLLSVGLPLLLVWVFAGQFSGEPLVNAGAGTGDAGPPPSEWPPLTASWGTVWIVRFIALGIALWVGFHRNGLAGDFAEPEYGLRPRALPGLLLRGALFGLGVYALCRWALPGPLEGLLARYQTLGSFNTHYWNSIAGRTLFAVGAVWFAAGILLYPLGRPGLAPDRRVALLALPVVAAFLAILVYRPFGAQRLASNLDITPQVLATAFPYSQRRPLVAVPNGPDAGKELARRAHITVGPTPTQPARDVLLFTPRAAFVALQEGITEDGLSAEPASGPRVLDFLKRRDFQTALSWPAIKHIYNVATVHFDTTDAIAACLLDLDRCPHALQCLSTVRSMLFTCSASPQNLALADEFADPARYDFPDRDSQKMMGDLFTRFGDVDKALTWYRRAEMPKSFMARVRQEKPLFHHGYVTGVLQWNGRPLAGVQVGLIPQRLNGLPRDLEPYVLHSVEDILPPRPYPPFFAPLHPRPFAFRWISAGTTTDANGAFTLNDLTQGGYLLVCTLPPGVHLNLGLDKTLHVGHAPRPINLHYGRPAVELGTIALSQSAAAVVNPEPQP